MKYDDYRPGPAVLERLKKVDLVMVIGPTAAGKTTLMNAVQARDSRVRLVLTTTSRDPRPDERDGVDFHFRSEADMQERIARREFVQVAPNVFGPLYATLPEDYTAAGVAMMAVLVDALPTFQKLPFKRRRQIFILPPSPETWRERIAAHGFTGQDLARRLKEAKTSLEYAATNSDVLFVLNDNLERAIQDFDALLRGQAASFSRSEARNLARRLLFTLEK